MEGQAQDYYFCRERNFQRRISEGSGSVDVCWEGYGEWLGRVEGKQNKAGLGGVAVRGVTPKRESESTADIKGKVWGLEIEAI